jgi:mannose-1-phosphate guanylyltransferase
LIFKSRDKNYPEPRFSRVWEVPPLIPLALVGGSGGRPPEINSHQTRGAKKMKDTFGVVLAGGHGTRFWPKSRVEKPKQLCVIGSGSQTMMEETFERLQGWIPQDRQILVTQKRYETSLPRGPRWILEPFGKNTAAALTLAALEIEKTPPFYGKSVMVSLHADHKIGDVGGFKKAIEDAVAVARREHLCLVGIKPTYPETGFGYLEKGPGMVDSPGFQVTRFKEKPPLALAREYLAQGGFLWNSGIFVWSVDVFLGEVGRFLPDLLSTLRELLGERTSFSQVDPVLFEKTYSQIESQAVDQGILEKSNRVACVEGDFGWHDVGSWGNLTQCFPGDQDGNLIWGQSYLKDCQGVTVDGSGTKALVVGVGLQDLVIVATEDAILVCHKDQAPRMKEVTELLKKNGYGAIL